MQQAGLARGRHATAERQGYDLDGGSSRPPGANAAHLDLAEAGARAGPRRQRSVLLKPHGQRTAEIGIPHLAGNRLGGDRISLRHVADEPRPSLKAPLVDEPAVTREIDESAASDNEPETIGERLGGSEEKRGQDGAGDRGTKLWPNQEEGPPIPRALAMWLGVGRAASQPNP